MAVDEQVASATQNQAMNALVFLYKRVLQLPLNETINAVRADRKVNVPVVLTPRGGCQGYLPSGGRASTDRETAVWQRVADHGGR